MHYVNCHFSISFSAVSFCEKLTNHVPYMGTRQRIKEARFSNPAIPISTFEALTIYWKLYLLILTIKMNTTFKVYPAIAMLAVILSCAMVSWCQICGKTAYGGERVSSFQWGSDCHPCFLSR